MSLTRKQREVWLARLRDPAPFVTDSPRDYDDNDEAQREASNKAASTGAAAEIETGPPSESSLPDHPGQGVVDQLRSVADKVAGATDPDRAAPAARQLLHKIADELEASLQAEQQAREEAEQDARDLNEEVDQAQRSLHAHARRADKSRAAREEAERERDEARSEANRHKLRAEGWERGVREAEQHRDKIISGWEFRLETAQIQREAAEQQLSEANARIEAVRSVLLWVRRGCLLPADSPTDPLDELEARLVAALADEGEGDG